METKELKLLDSSEFKVLKQITLISDRPNSEYEIGTIFILETSNAYVQLKKSKSKKIGLLRQCKDCCKSIQIKKNTPHDKD